MHYEVDLTDYKQREVVNHLIINDYEELTSSQRQLINYELVNFQDSFGKPWKEFTINELSYRLSTNWTMFLIEDLEIKGWSFIDWNYKYPYLKNRYVCPNFRGQGLGTELMNMRFNYLKEKNHNTFYGFVEDWNKPANPILQQEGIWKEISMNDIYK